MYKKVWCTCEVVVLIIKPIVFLTFSLSSASLDLKVPNKDIKIRRCGRQRERKKTIGFISTITLHVHHRSFVHFFPLFCTTTTWKCLISRFIEYVVKTSYLWTNRWRKSIIPRLIATPVATPSQGTWIDIVTENHALRAQLTDKSVICKQITVGCTDVQN